MIESNQVHATIKDTEVCHTLPASMGLGGGYIPMILQGEEQCGEESTEKRRSPSTRTTTSDAEIGGREREVVYGTEGEGMSEIRRLMPIECERLQGFPDGWTDIGEWTDSKGKAHKDADSPRYKALGNSIALPFWEWMAKRMAAVYDRPATMASLFDGIGGFPLAFQRAGVKPIWASEIEEFPMAVTKIRFPEGE